MLCEAGSWSGDADSDRKDPQPADWARNLPGGSCFPPDLTVASREIRAKKPTELDEPSLGAVPTGVEVRRGARPGNRRRTQVD